MTWTHRATSAKCQICGHGYGLPKTWSMFYAVSKSFVVGFCRACGRSEKIVRV